MTVSDTVDFEKVALSCGYRNVIAVSTRDTLKQAITKMKSLKGPKMLIVKIKKGARENLGRPTTTPI